MNRKETVYHLEKDGKHYYYGGVTALFANHSDLNIRKESIWNYRITEKKPYYGFGYIIRKGSIKRSERKKSFKK